MTGVPALVPGPRFVGFARSAPRELRDVDELSDLRAARSARLADVYTGAAPGRGLPRPAPLNRKPSPDRTALLARELTLLRPGPRAERPSAS